MIRLIEALNFRCLKYKKRTLQDFHVLVGPNASGKTTFLDVVSFLGDLVSGGLEKAVYDRTRDLKDLIWLRKGESFELAIELKIPDEKRNLLAKPAFDIVRYEVKIGIDPDTSENSILFEKVLLKETPYKGSKPAKPVQGLLPFPDEPNPPRTIATPKGKKKTQTIVNKLNNGNVNLYDETGEGFKLQYRLEPRKSALVNLLEDESKFPVSLWLKSIMMEGIQRLVLNSVLMREASPPGQPKRFRPDGSNLPWVVENLKAKHADRYNEWIEHLQTALPDLEGVKTIERPDDRHRYLVVCYKNNLEVPSWTASDGTLRLLALTLPAYLPELRGIYLIEEPENGIHPRAVETMFQSLSSVYDAQILLATHSPVILSVVDAHQVLCFSKTATGATDIVSGDEHPALRDWKGETNLGVLFVGGVLG
ncbi:MAG: ATP-binding protein [bacterium]